MQTLQKKKWNEKEAKGYLDHGFAKDINKWLAFKSRRSIAGGYDTNNLAPKLSVPNQISTSANGRSNCSSGYNAVHDPWSGRWRPRRTGGAHWHVWLSWVCYSGFPGTCNLLGTCKSTSDYWSVMMSDDCDIVTFSEEENTLSFFFLFFFQTNQGNLLLKTWIVEPMLNLIFKLFF